MIDWIPLGLLVCLAAFLFWDIKSQDKMIANVDE